jgi:hypothetical protein
MQAAPTGLKLMGGIGRHICGVLDAQLKHLIVSCLTFPFLDDFGGFLKMSKPIKPNKNWAGRGVRK